MSFESVKPIVIGLITVLIILSIVRKLKKLLFVTLTLGAVVIFLSAVRVDASPVQDVVWDVEVSEPDSKYVWEIMDYAFTTNEISTYRIPESAVNRSREQTSIVSRTEVEYDGKTYYRYSVDAAELYRRMVEQGVRPNGSNGEITVYAHPIVATYTRKGDSYPTRTGTHGEWLTENYVQDDMLYMSLMDWKRARFWRDSSQFYSYYNRELVFSIGASLTVCERFVGEQTDYYPVSGVSVGETLHYSNIRYDGGRFFGKSSDKKGSTYVLAGVEVSASGAAIFTSGSAVFSDGDSDGIWNIDSNSLTDGILGTPLFYDDEECPITLNRNMLYMMLCASNLRVSSTTVVTFIYTKAVDEVRVIGRQYFYSGDGNLRVSGKIDINDTGKPITATGEELGVTGQSAYGKSNKWQLVSLRLNELYRDEDSGFRQRIENNAWPDNAVRVSRGITSSYQDFTSQFNRLSFIPIQHKSTTYVYQGEYVIYAPQVELVYSRDTNGSLKLVEATTGGKALSTDYSAMRKNLYGGKGSKSWNFPVNYEYGGRKLQLGTAYAYEGPADNAVAGYLTDTENCWGDSILPSGGQTLEGLFTDNTGIGYTTFDNAWSYNESAGDRVTVSVDSVPMNPLIFVAVYDEVPEVSCMSFISNSTDLLNDTLLTYAGYREFSDAKVELAGKEYGIGRTAVLPIDTSSLDAQMVYALDGIDNSIADTVGTVNTSALTAKYTNMSDYYCTRYVWVTDVGDVEELLAGNGVMTFGVLKNITGGISDSTIRGKLQLENGIGLLIKIFTPKLVTDSGVWRVGYLDSGNGIYTRLARSQLIRFNYPIIDDANDGLLFERFIGEDYELVNVGYEDLPTSYEVDVTSGSHPIDGGTAVSLSKSSNSVQIDDQRFTAQRQDLEKLGNLGWLIDRNANPYGLPNSYGQQQFNESYVGQKKPASDMSAMVYVYRKPVSYYTSAVLEEDGAYYTLTEFEEHQLSPYTASYTVSYKPFIESTTTGNIYILKQICYKYQEGLEIVDVNGMSRLAVGSNKSSDGKLTSLSIMSNSCSKVMSLRGKELHTTGVYELYVPEGVEQKAPKIEKSSVYFTDTDRYFNAGGYQEGNNLKYAGFISSDDEFSSDEFDADQAIPSSEYIRASASVPNFLVDLEFLKESLTQEYVFAYYKAFNHKIIETDTYGNEVIKWEGTLYQHNLTVSRSNYHYSLAAGTVWVPWGVTIESGVLSTGNSKVFMNAKDSQAIADVLANGNTKLYGVELAALGITTGDPAEFTVPNFEDNGTYPGLNVCNGVQEYYGDDFQLAYAEWESMNVAFQDAVEARVGKVAATNEEVVFNDGSGHEFYLLRHTSFRFAVDDPIDAPEAPMCDAVDACNVGGALFSSKNNVDTRELQIDAELENGVYAAAGAVTYVTVPSVSRFCCKDGFDYSKENTGTFNAVAHPSSVERNLYVHNTTVLTPVTLDMVVSDESKWCQAYEPQSGIPLIIDKQFYVTLSTVGTHCGLPGYGTKDYLRYTKAFRIMFPFDAIVSFKDGQTSALFVKEGEWLDLKAYQDQLAECDYTLRVLIPVWEEERKLGKMQSQAIALNGDTDNPNPEYSANQNKEQLYGNGTDWSDAVIYSQLVRTYGRVYGLEILDIGDYPIWEDVFRNSDGTFKGVSVASGMADRDGIFQPYRRMLLPLVDGDHPSISNEGFIKAGYKVKFSLETVGELYHANDYVVLEPYFSRVSFDADGKETRDDVSVYYERNGKLVKVGSAEDLYNRNYYSLNGSDFPLIGSDVEQTGSIMGFGQDFLGRGCNWSFGRIELGQYVRVLSGESHSSNLGTQKLSLSETMKAYGDGKQYSASRLASGVQKWYGEYYLPAGLFITTAPEEEVRKLTAAGATYGDLREDGSYLWEIDGFLAVNFDIQVYRGGTLDYLYQANWEQRKGIYGEDREEPLFGSCDMWSVEQQPVRKNDWLGRTFTVERGDVLLYDLLDVTGGDRGGSGGGNAGGSSSGNGVGGRGDNAPGNYGGSGTH